MRGFFFFDSIYISKEVNLNSASKQCISCWINKLAHTRTHTNVYTFIINFNWFVQCTKCDSNCCLQFALPKRSGALFYESYIYIHYIYWIVLFSSNSIGAPTMTAALNEIAHLQERSIHDFAVNWIICSLTSILCYVLFIYLFIFYNDLYWQFTAWSH